MDSITKCIHKNYQMAERIKFLIRHERDTDEKIRLIRYLSWFYSMHITGKYSDNYLEKELCDIGRNIPFIKKTEIRKNEILHIMTEAYHVGGHTRVVANWIEFDSHHRYSLLFTEKVSKSKIPRFLMDCVTKSGGNVYMLTKKGAIEKAKQLLEIASGFEKIILHVNMYDVIPVLAFSNKKWDTPVLFYGHADARFWLGNSISDLVFDINATSNQRTRRLRGAKYSGVLSIPLAGEYKDRQNGDHLRLKYKIPQDAIVLTSMASDYKYKTVGDINFFKFIENILKKHKNVYFVVIGGEPNKPYWKSLLKKTNGRLKVLGYLEKEMVKQWLGTTDVYVNSFPIPSITSTMEAIYKYIPLLSLDLIDTSDEIKPLTSPNMKSLYEKFEFFIQNNVQNVIDREVYNSVINSCSKKEWMKRLNKYYSLPLKHEVKEFRDRKKIGIVEKIMFEQDSPNFLEGSLYHDLNTKNQLLIKLMGIMNQP